MGYVSIPSFSLAFRRYTGMSPGAWRRLSPVA
ncbi:AraC family transcriptional regulator [Kluyvera sichuanensis]|nr:AraC family transcriptional regulator [Kluyvera sichuanensis]